MSVINKMLRDLDKRQAAPAGGSAAPITGVRTLGTASVADTVRARRSPGLRKTLSPKVVLFLGACLVLLAGGWLWRSGVLSLPPAPGAALTRPPEARVVPAPITGSDPAPAQTPIPVAVAVPAVLPAPKPLSAPTPVPALAPMPTAQSPVPKQLAPEPVVVAAALAPVSANAPALLAAPAPVPVTAQSPILTPVTPTDIAQRQQIAGRDALAQAQALWNAGSRDAALDLMQQAVQAAERAASGGGAGPAQAQVLLPLVRELSRMLLAESRPAPVWELLARLEPLLDKQADMWAVRANAAQRLGRHQDSVHAYLMALQLGPAEQRWHLGAAVSLAALGQTASAAEMAEKARAMGAVSKDVQTYLRQMGVEIKD
jgi:MSHA biogenesis protein MshN